MTPETTLDQALLGLAFLLNQTSVPAAERTRWTFFVTSGVERLYRSFDFDAAKVTVDLTTGDDGRADLSDLNIGAIPAISFLGTTESMGSWQQVPPEEFQNFTQGDKRWCLERTEDGEWYVKTTEPGATIVLKHYEGPVIANNQPVVFTRMVIAKAALIYYRQAQDPEADTAPEEDQLKQEVSEITEQQNRNRAQRFATSRRDQMGHALGEN